MYNDCSKSNSKCTIIKHYLYNIYNPCNANNTTVKIRRYILGNNNIVRHEPQI